ncbi:uncharacterized mitochondrial protein AtMg00310-like [Lotus japonicus]|uniref:uncharacterized mitochondrial protein AtMg00310-like n=1 Tax=Lotus japonicus TaxID=34305 RepID=UPI0025909988|nr:uncharacterized mitochondrial protein AtMg00310-like [Lotus japonicus]
MISRFWWGSKQGERKILWINWNALCQPKYDGGMGFRGFKAWRLSTCTDSLVYKCLKARYFPRTDFMDAFVGGLSSYTWRSIQQSAWILKKGTY